jgi:hypothetical protein
VSLCSRVVEPSGFRVLGFVGALGDSVNKALSSFNKQSSLSSDAGGCLALTFRVAHTSVHTPCTSRGHNVKMEDLKASHARNGRCGANFLVAGPSAVPRWTFRRGFEARREARTRPLMGIRYDTTRLENVERRYLDRLSPREGRGVAFTGEIALLAVPRGTLAKLARARSCAASHEKTNELELAGVPDQLLVLSRFRLASQLIECAVRLVRPTSRNQSIVGLGLRDDQSKDICTSCTVQLCRVPASPMQRYLLPTA